MLPDLIRIELAFVCRNLRDYGSIVPGTREKLQVLVKGAKASKMDPDDVAVVVRSLANCIRDLRVKRVERGDPNTRPEWIIYGLNQAITVLEKYKGVSL